MGIQSLLRIHVCLARRSPASIYRCRRFSGTDTRIVPVVKSLVRNIWPRDNPDLRRRVAASVGLLMANVCVPFMMKLVIDQLNGNVALDDLTTSQLLATDGAMRMCSFGFNELKNAIFAKVAQENIRRTQLEAFKHIHDLDLGFHLSRRTGMISKVLDRGTRSISFILKTLVFNWVPTLFEILLVVSLMAYKFGGPFVITAVSCVMVYAAFTLAVTRWRIKYRILMNTSDNQAGATIFDSLVNYETVKYFNNERHESQQLDDTLKDFEQASIKTSVSLAALNSGQSFIFSASLVAIMLLSSQQIISGTMTIGDLVMVNGLLFQLSVPLYFLGSLYRDIREAVVNLNNLYTIMAERQIVKNAPNARSIDIEDLREPLSAFISLRNVHFGYTPGKYVLRGINLDVPFNKKVAIVGGSGSGKSTIARLLYRFYDPDVGQVTINGQNISTLTMESLRKAITVVPQDQVLFHNTIKYNIQYGRMDASFEEIQRASQMAGMHDVILGFPNGYNTQVGERGLKLSGGEKQRVAIARAILKNAPIFVYDEATSSLDSLMEKKILQTIHNVLKNKTTIMIAHRLSTIVDADIIYVLKDGRVHQQGTHSQLLEDPLGLYAEMWRKQNDTIYKPTDISLNDQNGDTLLTNGRNELLDDEINNALDQQCGISENCCKS